MLSTIWRGFPYFFGLVCAAGSQREVNFDTNSGISFPSTRPTWNVSVVRKLALVGIEAARKTEIPLIKLSTTIMQTDLKLKLFALSVKSKPATNASDLQWKECVKRRITALYSELAIGTSICIRNHNTFSIRSVVHSHKYQPELSDAEWHIRYCYLAHYITGVSHRASEADGRSNERYR